MSNFSILEAESKPPTALVTQFVVVQYSSKIPLSPFALSDSVCLYSSRCTHIYIPNDCLYVSIC
ncbi:hypothetical protein C1H46_010115 [Malus baccata]|uniref:Uncharacterized protein n=1 Tax=Malus baccata TaxID=106549 RepID=A0A540N1C4_MALBA|nr:hypothetical protein C1H46_010115 [Malus baccata]